MNRFQPDCRHTLTPRIVTPDVTGLTEFLRAVFNGQGESRSGAPTEMKIGDSIIMISDGGGLRNAMPAFLYVYVEDADQTYTKAVDFGAQSIESPLDTPYGDRRAMVQDSWGNLWQIATHKTASGSKS